MRGKRIKYVLLGFLVLISLKQSIRAQYIEVRTELDTNQIRIGEPLHLDILVHQPEEIRVDFPVFTDTVVDKLEIIESIPADTIRKEGDLDIHKRYMLTSFDSGLYIIPPMKFQFHSDVPLRLIKAVHSQSIVLLDCGQSDGVALY